MRLRALDGWRGVACLYVALYHLNAAHSLWDARWLTHPEPVLEFFFLLSGFVMAMGFADAIHDGRSFIAYLIRRLGRVLPLHLFTFALLLALVGAKSLAGAHHGGFSVLLRPEAILPQLLAIQTWVGQGLSWNYPAWTMSAEMGAYLVFGVLVALLRTRLLRLIGAALLVAGAGVLFFADLTAPASSFNIVTVSRCFTAFFLGFVLYEAWRALPAPPLWAATALQVVAIFAAIICLNAHFTGAAYFLNHLAALLLVLAFAHDGAPIARLLSAPPLLWLGKLSFSLYMIHAVIMIYLQTAFYALERISGREFVSIHLTPYGEPRELISLGPACANNLLLGVYMAAVVLVAMWVYRWVEDPSRRVSGEAAKRYERGALALNWSGSRALLGVLWRYWTGAFSDDRAKN